MGPSDPGTKPVTDPCSDPPFPAQSDLAVSKGTGAPQNCGAPSVVKEGSQLEAGPSSLDLHQVAQGNQEAVGGTLVDTHDVDRLAVSLETVQIPNVLHRGYQHFAAASDFGLAHQGLHVGCQFEGQKDGLAHKTEGYLVAYEA